MSSAARFVIAALLFATGAVGCRDSPQDALRAFYSNHWPECTLEGPLWKGGRPVVPVVIEAIADKDMPRRRYAISFLGNMRDRRALNALNRILSDDNELDYYRADALAAIQKIDFDLGKQLAQVHSSGEGLLGEWANGILQGYEFHGYTFWERLLGPGCQ